MTTVKQFQSHLLVYISFFVCEKKWVTTFVAIYNKENLDFFVFFDA